MVYIDIIYIQYNDLDRNILILFYEIYGLVSWSCFIPTIKYFGLGGLLCLKSDSLLYCTRDCVGVVRLGVDLWMVCFYIKCFWLNLYLQQCSFLYKKKNKYECVSQSPQEESNLGLILRTYLHKIIRNIL